jgi:hypothetical protein
MQTHSVGSGDAYSAELRGFIIGSEGFDSKVYLDYYGKLTIGYGYNISDNDFVSDFAGAGISLTQEKIDLLNDLKGRINKDVIAYNSNPNSITINEEEANTLYNTIIGNKFETPTLAKFDKTRANELRNTKELIALVSLAYNGGVTKMIGPNLMLPLMMEIGLRHGMKLDTLVIGIEIMVFKIGVLKNLINLDYMTTRTM